MEFFLLSSPIAMPGVPTGSAKQDLMPPWSEAVDGTRNSKKKSVKVVCSSPESEGGGVRKIKGLDDLSCPSLRNRCDKHPDAFLSCEEFQSG